MITFTASARIGYLLARIPARFHMLPIITSHEAGYSVDLPDLCTNLWLRSAYEWISFVLGDSSLSVSKRARSRGQAFQETV
jgi:hypothetical protein